MPVNNQAVGTVQETRVSATSCHQCKGRERVSRWDVKVRSRWVEVCLAPGASVLLFILSFLLSAEILSLSNCLRAKKWKYQEHEERRAAIQEGEMRAGRRYFDCVRLVCVSVAAQ